MPEKKTATVALLATDIQGSTAMARRIGEEAYGGVLDQHHEMLEREIARFGGTVYSDTGDGLLACFQTAGLALSCGLAIQRTLAEAVWKDLPRASHPPKVRIAIHAGHIEQQNGRYRGLALHDLSRILDAGHGGQILISEVAASLLRRDIPEEVLISDLGVFRLRDAPAPEHLFQALTPGMGDGSFPPPRAVRFQTPNLPGAHTSFVGRDSEMEQLRAMILKAITRFLTIVGPGGSGKTRLAMEVARGLVDHFTGAVWFVPLSDISDPEQMIANIGAALRLESIPEAALRTEIVRALGLQPSLLVLDNFEDLVPGGVQELRNLLENIPTLRCVVTSRQRAGISFEREYELLPLPRPETGASMAALARNASIQLFEDRAKRARAHFTLTEANAPAVAELCGRLDGIPLAIELCAAWAKVLTPQQMLSQLKEILVSRDRDVAERHQSLEAVLQASFRMMPPELQRFFCRLSVFRGGWTAEAAREVGDEPRTLDCLSQLRDRSMVQADEVEDGMRFRMLETLRDFAAERLEEDAAAAADARIKHGLYFTSLARLSEPELQGKDQASWLRKLDVEYQNLRAVLDTADLETRLRLPVMLNRFLVVRGHLREARRWLDDALREASNDTDQHARVRALTAAGVFANATGDLDAARIHWEERLKLCSAAGDPRQIAISEVNLASLLSQQGDYDSAQLHYEKGLEVFRRLDDRKLIAITLSNLGGVVNEQRDYERARRLLEESLFVGEDSGDVLLRANTLHNLAVIEFRLGDDSQARRHLRLCLSLRLELGDRSAVGQLIELLAKRMRLDRRYEVALRLYGAAESVRALTQTSRVPGGQAEIKEELESIRMEMPEPEYSAAWAAGEAMSWEEVSTYMLEKLGDE